jgi:signal transduction histidine kinase
MPWYALSVEGGASEAIGSPELEGIARGWSRAQARYAVPIMLIIVGVLAQARYPIWRLAVILLSQPLLLLIRRIFFAHSVQRMTGWGWAALLTGNWMIAAVSGGLASPLVPLFVGPPLGALTVYGGGRVGKWIFACVLSGAAVLAAITLSAPGPRMPSATFALAGALACLLTFVMARNGLLAMAEAHQDNREALERMRAAVLSEARDRVRSLETIGARVGHELKNPLTALKGLLPLLQRDALDEKSRQRFDVVAHEVTRMEETVRGYLSFSRPLDDLQLQPIDVARVIADVFAVLEGRAQSGGVRLSLDAAATPIEADAHRLRDALLNLVANAIDAIDNAGFVRVSLRDDGEDIIITVADNGKGMSADVLARLGRPFFSTKGQGTGLGIVLARATVEQHGGTLSFASAVDRGTTATMRLPKRVPQKLRRKPLSVS